MRARLIVSVIAISTLFSPMLPGRAVTSTPYLVGAATADISPYKWGTINLGGFGFGDGSSIISQELGPGGKGHMEDERIAARAVAIKDTTTGNEVVLTTVETQGMFAAYENPLDKDAGLIAIEQQAASAIGIPASNIIISNDHTHSGPDAIGVWGFIPHDYLNYIASQTVSAIEAAHNAMQPATIVAGADDAPDLIYTQTCTEALNQGPSDNYPNTVCDPLLDGKDSWVRVMQARSTADGSVITTVMSYAAHSTLGGGAGVHGDWPQFMSDALTAKYGGVGIAFEGTNGRIQPCRPRCSFTDSSTPGYDIADRKTSYVTMLSYHVERALLDAPEVSGPVEAAKTFIRHEVSNPIVIALLNSGAYDGAQIQRSAEKPWYVANTIRTVVSAIRIGDLLINGAPGEPYPNIAAGVVEETNVPAQRHWTLALADDQLGYLIAPTEASPAVYSQIAVNDNPIFNVSPSLGDHVMCAQIRMSRAVGFRFQRIVPNARCVVFDTIDSAGDPLGS
ncbi:MAG: hypothetical protein ACYDCC_07305 [Actinomycetota bacterium]